MQHAISKFIIHLMVLKYNLLIIFLVLTFCAGILPAPTHADDGSALLKSEYITKVVDKDGHELYRMITPVKPPEIKVPAVEVPQESVAGVLSLSNVPAFDWSYGCSTTSAAMMFGYYERTGYSNIYTGPTNGGICPMDNSVWGHTAYPNVTCGECPISATHNGNDGRATRGHADDYWIDYENAGPDPYITNGWVEHLPFDCTADFMGTNQSKYSNTDGSTSFYYYGSGAPLSNYTGCEPGDRDGCHGMRLFAESRGYTVLANYSQLIQGVGSDPTLGFTFANYCSEINAERPVLIQVEGHTMLGDGYNTTGNLVYLHDTWDYSDHQMTWGGNYSGMAHRGVTVLQLAPTGSASITVTSPNGGENWGVGTSHPITWTSTNLTGNLAITLSRNGGSTYTETLATSVPENTGSSTWVVTGPASTTCRVKITSIADPSVSDISNDNFAIYDLPPSPTVTLSLLGGWNLISLPLITSPTPTEVFSALPQGWALFAWDAANSRYLGGVQISLVPGMGYWLKLPGSNPLSYLISGQLVTSDPFLVPLSNGWNMVGTPYLTNIPWEKARLRYLGNDYTLNEAVTQNYIAGAVYYWTGIGYGNAAGGNFEPGKGYWLKTKMSGCTLILPGDTIVSGVVTQQYGTGPVSGIAGVTVVFLEGTTQIGTTTTNNNGAYTWTHSFSNPTTLTVRFDNLPPTAPGSTETKTKVVNGVSSTYPPLPSLATGGNNTVDLHVLQVVDSTVSGVVTQQYGTGPVNGIADVTVVFLEGATQIGTTTTDTNGAYTWTHSFPNPTTLTVRFDGLPPPAPGATETKTKVVNGVSSTYPPYASLAVSSVGGSNTVDLHILYTPIE